MEFAAPRWLGLDVPTLSVEPDGPFASPPGASQVLRIGHRGEGVGADILILEVVAPIGDRRPLTVMVSDR